MVSELCGMLRIILCLALLLCPGCSQKQSNTPAAGSRYAEFDREMTKDLAESGRTAPAVAWLKDPQNTLWKGDRKAILTHFEQLEKAGVKNIYAVGIEDVEGRKIAAAFAAELPAEKAQRGKVIAMHNLFWKDYLGPDVAADDLKDFTAEDHGQKFLDYNFDL